MDLPRITEKLSVHLVILIFQGYLDLNKEEEDEGREMLTRRVRVKSLRAKLIHWPRSVLGRNNRKRMLVALVHSCSTVELKKLVADGRLFSSDTTICISWLIDWN